MGFDLHVSGFVSQVGGNGYLAGQGVLPLITGDGTRLLDALTREGQPAPSTARPLELTIWVDDQHYTIFRVTGIQNDNATGFASSDTVDRSYARGTRLFAGYSSRQARAVEAASAANTAGGTTGQVLAKTSDADYDYSWTTPVKLPITEGDVSWLQTDLAAIATRLDTKAPLDGADFSGPVTVPSPISADNSTRAATTNWVRTYIGSLGTGNGGYPTLSSQGIDVTGTVDVADALETLLNATPGRTYWNDGTVLLNRPIYWHADDVGLTGGTVAVPGGAFYPPFLIGHYPTDPDGTTYLPSTVRPAVTAAGGTGYAFATLGVYGGLYFGGALQNGPWSSGAGYGRWGGLQAGTFLFRIEPGTTATIPVSSVLFGIQDVVTNRCVWAVVTPGTTNSVWFRFRLEGDAQGTSRAIEIPINSATANDILVWFDASGTNGVLGGSGVAGVFVNATDVSGSCTFAGVSDGTFSGVGLEYQDNAGQFQIGTCGTVYGSQTAGTVADFVLSGFAIRVGAVKADPGSYAARYRPSGADVLVYIDFNALETSGGHPMRLLTVVEGPQGYLAETTTTRALILPIAADNRRVSRPTLVDIEVQGGVCLVGAYYPHLSGVNATSSCHFGFTSAAYKQTYTFTTDACVFDGTVSAVSLHSAIGEISGGTELRNVYRDTGCSVRLRSGIMTGFGHSYVHAVASYRDDYSAAFGMEDFLIDNENLAPTGALVYVENSSNGGRSVDVRGGGFSQPGTGQPVFQFVGGTAWPAATAYVRDFQGSGTLASAFAQFDGPAGQWSGRFDTALSKISTVAGSSQPGVVVDGVFPVVTAASLRVLVSDPAEVGDVVAAAATQTANLRENRAHDNTTVLSAVSPKGDYILSTTSGAPSDTVAAGSVRVDVSGTLYVSTGSAWNVVGGGGSLAAGSTISGVTNGAILYADGTGKLASSSNLTFDGTYLYTSGGTVQIGSGQIILSGSALIACQQIQSSSNGDLNLQVKQGSCLAVKGYTGQTGRLVKLTQQSSTDTARPAGYLDATLPTPTDASFLGQVTIFAADHTGTDREGLRVASDGTQALLGFYGGSAVARPTGDVVAGLEALGLMTGATVSSGAPTVGDAVSGATANAVLYADGTGKLASSSNLTFDGTTLTAENVAIPDTKLLNLGAYTLGSGSGQLSLSGSGTFSFGIPVYFTQRSWTWGSFNGPMTFTGGSDPMLVTCTDSGTTPLYVLPNGASPASLVLQRYSSTSTARDAGVISATLPTSVDAGRLGKLTLAAADYTGANREGLAIQSDGTQALVSVYGVSPVARAASPGTASGTDAAVVNAIVTAGRNFGIWS